MEKGLREYLLDAVYPKRCPICGRVPSGRTSKEPVSKEAAYWGKGKEKKAAICLDCRKKLPIIKEPRCMRCSKPILDREKEYCYDCMEKSSHFNCGKALWIYDDVMRESIARFKYKGSLEYAEFYGEEAVKQYGNWVRGHADILVPVPLHRRKKRKRGYNQAEVFAKEIGRRLQISVETDLLYRSRDTKPQKELNDKERLKNLSEAFQVKTEKLCRLGKIMLIDDIYTTGSTIEACASSLRRAGAEEVYFFSICIGKGF